MIHQQLCRKPIAGDQSAIEKTVMDDTLAAGWAFGFQDCLFAAGFPADFERLLCTRAELSGDIVSRIVYNAILYSSDPSHRGSDQVQLFSPSDDSCSENEPHPAEPFRRDIHELPGAYIPLRRLCAALRQSQ